MDNKMLIAELVETLGAVNHTLDELRERHKQNRKAALAYTDFHPSFYAMVDTTGRPMIGDLLSAKANVLVALTALYQLEKANVMTVELPTERD